MFCSRAPDARVARAQVWLGTLVAIALPALDATDARFAAAFAAIAHVHRKMSAHDPTSDLAQIAKEAHLRAVVVDRQTCSVLKLALTLSRETRGAFDVSVPASGERDRAPPRKTQSRAVCDVDATLILERGNRVRATAPVALDLGGIAKGYAVDRAVAALRASGARGGIVSAGGDLRAFGPLDWVPVRVRHPANPAIATRLFDVRDAAAATSADYFRAGRAALLDPSARRIRRFGGSVTVVAPTCALADALTKVVAVDPSRAAAILARHGAHAFRLEHSDGTVRASTTLAASTTHLRLPPAVAA